MQRTGTSNSERGGAAQLWNTLIAVALLAVVIAVAAAPRAHAADVPFFTEQFTASPLNPSWTVQDGYALDFPTDTPNHASFAAGPSHLSISIPAGAEHNMWWMRQAQATRAYEGSGVYEIKVDSALSGDQQFGLVFENTRGTFLIFMLYASGSVWGYAERFVEYEGGLFRTTFPGAANGGHNTGMTVPAPGPYWLRVILRDDPNPADRTWTFQWSADGNQWTTVVSGSLESEEPGGNIGDIRRVGLFAGNQPTGFSALNARFDFYRTFPLSALPLSGPAQLVAQPGDQRVTLNWQPVVDASSYTVHRSTTPGGPYTPVTTVTGTTYTDIGLANGTRYAYVVTALVNGATSLLSNEAKAIPHVPQDISSLPVQGRQVMLSASELAYLLIDGEQVTAWHDAAMGSGAATALSFHAPSFVAAGLSGRPAVRFDGQNDFLNLTGAFDDFSAGLTMFVVARPSALQSGSKLVLMGNGAGEQNIALGRNGSGSGLQYFTNNGAGSFGWFGTQPALITGEAAIYMVLQPGGQQNAQVPAAVSKNGTVLGGGTVYVPPVATRTLNHIGRSYWAADGYFAGDIADIIIYNRQLTVAEQGAVQSFLGQKYGIAIAPPPALPVPGGLAATAGDAQVKLNWSGASGAIGYRVYRRTAPSTVYARVFEGTATNFTDTGVANGVTYGYVVTAFDINQETAYSAEALATPAPLPVLTIPPQLPAQGLSLLLDAGNIALTAGNGSEVTLWRDASGQVRDASMIAGLGPTLVTGAIGGKAAVRFDGQNDHLSLTAGFNDFTAGLTVFAVARPSAVQAGSKLLLLGNGAGQANIGLGRDGSNEGLLYFTTNSGGSFGWFTTQSALASGQTAVYTLSQPGGAAGAQVLATISRNGAPVGSGSVFVPPVITRGENYLGRSYWGGDGYFAGDVAEVIVYNRQLTAAEQEAVQNYLSQKYGVSITPPPALTPPASFNAAAGDARVTLTWSAASGAAGYRVYRRFASGTAYTRIYEGAATSFTDTGVVNGTGYGYVVTAYDATRESAYSTEALATPSLPLSPPAAIPAQGLTLLLDAGNVAAGNGSEVAVWRDASGQARDATTAAGAGPVLVSAAIGGRPALRFDGQNDHLSLPTGFEDFTQGLTLFVVAKPSAVQPGSKIFLLGNGGGQGNVAFGRNGGDAALQYFTNDAGGNFGWFGTQPALTTDQAALYTVAQPGGAPNAAIQATVSRNAASVGSGTVYVPPLTTRGVNYLGRSYWGSDGYFAGDIAEVILYNRQLSAAELSAVHTYLGQKYGITLP